MLVVTKNKFHETINLIKRSTHLSLDTETTGLRVHHDDRLFSIVISSDFGSFYFNYNNAVDFRDDQILDKRDIPFFSDVLTPEKTVFFANAKFDMHMLSKEGVHVASKIWDVLLVDKCLNNSHMNYDLASVASRRGFEKLSTVEEHIKKHKLYTTVKKINSSGKEVKTKNPHYNLVPADIIIPYAIRDADITYQIGMKQLEEVNAIDMECMELKMPSFWEVVERESDVIKACYEMEKRGFKVDEQYIQRASSHEEEKIKEACKEYEALTGGAFIDSNKALGVSFKRLGIEGGRTALGNPSFTDEVLRNVGHPISEIIRTIRNGNKKVFTYYKSFLAHADEEGAIHCSIRVAGADTFRFSITDPALQTIPSEEGDEEFKVRNCFVAREGFKLFSIDYRFEEYALMADYAGQMDLIERLNRGEDVHQATAEMMGVERKIAKTLGFMLLYGGGIQKLADALGVGYAKAKELKDKYFSALPHVRAFINKAIYVAERRKYIFNWAGRQLKVDPKYSYKTPNMIIQSSGAEIMRVAIIRIEEFLKDKKSKLLLSIHDEVVGEVHESEMDIIPQIQEIMSSIYPAKNGIKLLTSASVGERWGEL